MLLVVGSYGFGLRVRLSIGANYFGSFTGNQARIYWVPGIQTGKLWLKPIDDLMTVRSPQMTHIDKHIQAPNAILLAPQTGKCPVSHLQCYVHLHAVGKCPI